MAKIAIPHISEAPSGAKQRRSDGKLALDKSIAVLIQAYDDQ